MDRLIRFMNTLACVILFCLPILIVIDVICRRFFNAPILGILDITEMFGGLMMFFALPFATAASHQVSADFLLQKLSPAIRTAVGLFTRCLGVVLFLLIGWNLILKGMDIYSGGEISATLKMPLYPAAFVAGIMCFLQCFVLIVDAVRRSRAK